MNENKPNNNNRSLMEQIANAQKAGDAPLCPPPPPPPPEDGGKQQGPIDHTTHGAKPKKKNWEIAR